MFKGVFPLLTTLQIVCVCLCVRNKVDISTTRFSHLNQVVILTQTMMLMMCSEIRELFIFYFFKAAIVLLLIMKSNKKRLLCFPGGRFILLLHLEESVCI